MKFAEAEALARNLINTPTSDMGPEDLASAVKNLANKFDAEYSEIVGENLIAKNFPLIHTVGRASSQEPRLLEINTFRYTEHVGTGYDFDAGYRCEKAFESWKKNDPLIQDVDTKKRFTAEIEKQITEAVLFAEKSPWSADSELLSDVI